MKRAVGEVTRAWAAGRVGDADALRPMRVLVAEDNAINQIVARGTLEKLGMKVELVSNGAEALRKLEGDAAKKYDLVLMDIQMPVMDGFEAVATLRADRRFDSLPVVAMTAHAFTAERDKCFSLGMQDHIAKPFRIQELRDVLDRWSPANRPAKLDIPDTAGSSTGL